LRSRRFTPAPEEIFKSCSAFQPLFKLRSRQGVLGEMRFTSVCPNRSLPQDWANMSNGKRSFPGVREMKRRRFYTDLLTAVIAGLILSGLLAAALWLLARYRV